MIPAIFAEKVAKVEIACPPLHLCRLLLPLQLQRKPQAPSVKMERVDTNGNTCVKDRPLETAVLLLGIAELVNTSAPTFLDGESSPMLSISWVKYTRKLTRNHLLLVNRSLAPAMKL